MIPHNDGFDFGDFAPDYLLVTGRLEEVLREINRVERSRVHIAYGGGFG